MAKQQETKTPEKTLRLGLVSASVWVNVVKGENGNREIRNVNLQRRYKDGDDWKDSTSFGRDDLPLVAKVTDLAHSWIFGVTPEQLASAAAEF